MVNGLLNKEYLTIDTPSDLYTVPSSVDYMKVTLNVLNAGSDVAKLKVAISPDNTPTNSDYIENGVEIPELGGVYKQQDIIVGPGEHIIVEANKACAVRLTGVAFF